MSSLNMDTHTIELRADGHLKNLNDWTPELAERMAAAEGLVLTEQHWDVMNIMREYYAKYNTSPILKLLRRELSKQFDKERGSIESLDALFPRGVQKQGSRLAGVPMAMLDVELDQEQRMQSVATATEKSAAQHQTTSQYFNDQFDFNGKSIKLYASGNLVNLNDWNEDLAQVLAQKEGIELSDEHWEVINFLRKFYFQYGITPMVKVLIRHMAEEFGKAVANRQKMYNLFPEGPANQGSRIAGLPSPQGCIDS